MGNVSVVENFEVGILDGEADREINVKVPGKCKCGALEPELRVGIIQMTNTEASATLRLRCSGDCVDRGRAGA
ncbi:hypothetical protein HQ544_01830 [Candidatus Falkowbacteria bacterium]|nr:hypothetical protein [Candidatus Falkowbacteria bacterium]